MSSWGLGSRTPRDTAPGQNLHARKELTTAETDHINDVQHLQDTIDDMMKKLSSVDAENKKNKKIVEEIVRAVNSSHDKSPYPPTNPETEYTSKTLNKELNDFNEVYKIKVEFPKEFICPITHDIMVEPVTTSGGHTYEWSAISHWFKNKNKKDPATNIALMNAILYPNHALRSLISNFIPTCKLIINELRKKEGLNKTQRSIRMRSAPAEYGTRSMLYVKPNISTRSRLVSKTRTNSKVKASSKSRSSSTAKSRARETAPSTSSFIQELDARE